MAETKVTTAGNCDEATKQQFREMFEKLVAKFGADVTLKILAQSLTDAGWHEEHSPRRSTFTKDGASLTVTELELV